MHVQEPENLGLRITERVQHCAGFERRVFRQVHDELHSDSPIASVMAFGHAKFRVKLLADRTDGTVCNDR